MEINFKVTKCKQEDIKYVIEITKQAKDEGFLDEITYEGLKECLSKSDYYYIIVAKKNKEVLGFASSSYSWGKLHILDIGVRKDLRRKGIANALVLHLTEHAKRKKLIEVYCEVKQNNTGSLKYFLNHGFKKKALYSIAGGFYALYYPLFD